MPSQLLLVLLIFGNYNSYGDDGECENGLRIQGSNGYAESPIRKIGIVPPVTLNSPPNSSLFTLITI